MTESGIESATTGPTGRQDSALPAVLRGAATRAADLCRGPALIFRREPPDLAPRLRAAAGVSSAESAREAARELAETVDEVVRWGSQAQRPALASLGAGAAGATWVLPLRFAGRVHGALAVGVPAPPGPEIARELDRLAEDVALWLDHARLHEEAEALRAQLGTRSGSGEEKNDELLMLSEQLFAQDIELLRNNEKLGQVERLKNDFIEKMSRELRTPLNGIIEAIIAVLASENEALSASAQATLRSALDDGTAFLRTLQNILDLWRIKQKELPLEIHDVNFHEVVEEAIFSVQDSLDSKPVVIEKRLEASLARIRTDLAKINQILFLLLDNAVKFTTEGRVEIVARLVDGKLSCEIRDTGIGICPDDQQFVFDEFYQVDELASTKYRGSGLGLALVRDLLALMDGEISLSSDAGKGSVFRFQVPVQVTG